MSSTLFTAKKSPASILADLLSAGQDFHNSGKTFTGEHWGMQYAPSQGRMADDEYAVMMRRSQGGPIEYVVRSYDTVIGYKVTGQWILSAAKYSPTSSQHQSKLRAALG